MSRAGNELLKDIQCAESDESSLPAERKASLLVQRIRTSVRDDDLTQDQASERGGLELRHWQRLEAGTVNTTLQSLAKIANALEVDPVVLVSKPPRR